MSSEDGADTVEFYPTGTVARALHTARRAGTETCYTAPMAAASAALAEIQAGLNELRADEARIDARVRRAAEITAQALYRQGRHREAAEAKEEILSALTNFRERVDALRQLSEKVDAELGAVRESNNDLLTKLANALVEIVALRAEIERLQRREEPDTVDRPLFFTHLREAWAVLRGRA